MKFVAVVAGLVGCALAGKLPFYLGGESGAWGDHHE